MPPNDPNPPKVKTVSFWDTSWSTDPYAPQSSDSPSSPESTGQVKPHTIYDDYGAIKSSKWESYFEKETEPLRKAKHPEEWYNRKITELIPKIDRRRGLIGLEIEMEGKDLFRNPLKFWNMDIDGSLRTFEGHPPAEYVLKKPLSHDDLKEALKYLQYQLKSAGSEVVISHRCSIHVHLNVQTWTLRKIYCLILLYIIFEDILVEWSGPTRIGNCFCLRVKDSDHIVEMLCHALQKESFMLWNEQMRYGAVNVNSILKFGSLEFRSLRGTDDFNLINKWIVLLLNLKEKSLLYDNPIDIMKDFLALGPEKFFDKIWSKHKATLGYQNNLSQRLWEGFRIARDVAYTTDWKPYNNKKKVEEEPEEIIEEPIEQPSMGLTNCPPDIKLYHGDTMMTKWGSRKIRSRDQGEYVVRFYDWNEGDYGGIKEIALQENETMYFFEQDDRWIVVDIRNDNEED